MEIMHETIPQLHAGLDARVVGRGKRVIHKKKAG